MKVFLLLSTIATALCTCSPRLGSNIVSKQPVLSEVEFILILQIEDEYINDGIEIGTLKVGDNGMSTNCTYSEVAVKMRDIARANGANLIKITERKSPDQWSSCERIKAKLFRVPDFRKHEREIEWSEDRKLVWEDFKGTPKPFTNSGIAAISYCSFEFAANQVTIFSKAKIFSRSVFSCHLSWVREDQKYRQDLLDHEQGHFDLCEVFTRQLRKELLAKGLGVANLRNDANVVFKKVYAEYLDSQERYETETNHGLNADNQKYWGMKISTDLRYLRLFYK